MFTQNKYAISSNKIEYLLKLLQLALTLELTQRQNYSVKSQRLVAPPRPQTVPQDFLADRMQGGAQLYAGPQQREILSATLTAAVFIRASIVRAGATRLLYIYSGILEES